MRLAHSIEKYRHITLKPAKRKSRPSKLFNGFPEKSEPFGRKARLHNAMRAGEKQEVLLAMVGDAGR